MIWDLGWLDMLNKRWLGAFIAISTVMAVFAQDPGTEPEAIAGSSEPLAANEVDKAAAELETEAIATETPVVDDDYVPTERISEDRSVSFPVDI